MGAKGVKKALWVEVLKSNGAPIRPGPLYMILLVLKQAYFWLKIWSERSQ